MQGDKGAWIKGHGNRHHSTAHNTLRTCKRQKTGHISPLIYSVHIGKAVLCPTQISPSLHLPTHHPHQARTTCSKVAGATVLRGFTEEKWNPRAAAAVSPTADQHTLSPKSKSWKREELPHKNKTFVNHPNFPPPRSLPSSLYLTASHKVPGPLHVCWFAGLSHWPGCYFGKVAILWLLIRENIFKLWHLLIRKSRPSDFYNRLPINNSTQQKGERGRDGSWEHIQYRHVSTLFVMCGIFR